MYHERITKKIPHTHTCRDGGTDSFLTLNSPIPADPTDGTGEEAAVTSQIGGVITQRVWSRNPQEMLDHVTRDWRNNYVTADVRSYDDLHEFAIRPFVLIVKLDAPVLERFRRMIRYIFLFLALFVTDGGRSTDCSLICFPGWRNTTSRWRNSSSNTMRKCTGGTCSIPNRSKAALQSKSWRNWFIYGSIIRF